MPSSRSSQPSAPQPHPYQITDPTPRNMSKSSNSSTTSWKHSGRGGAGNVVRVPPPTSLTPITPTNTRASATSSQHSNPIKTGRGGAGNFHRVPSEKRMFSFDEELALQLRRSSHPAPIYHVGRGGAGNTAKLDNLMYIDGSSRRRESSATDSSSEKSEGSAPRNIMKKIGRTVGKAGDYFIA